MDKIVVALGGNALGNTPEEQKERAAHAARALTDLIEAGHSVVVCHGNGPQVGMIHLAMDVAAQNGAIGAEMPLPECGAMSQGYIGFHLQNALANELRARGMDRTVVTLLTQVIVDEHDKAFSAPTKPIGYFYTREQAERISAEKGYRFVEDSGRGYRQVVASPMPVDVEEKNIIRELVRSGVVTIAVGGGGIPVVRRGGSTQGVTAVVDKDFAAAKLAELVEADTLLLLTAVDAVAVNFGRPDQRALHRTNVEELRGYVSEGQFAPGSMLPKIEAAIAFLERRPRGRVIIASLERASDAIDGRTGTTITA